jgi:hypothetical protein
MFWIGLTVGVFIGVAIGGVAMGWIAAGKIAGERLDAENRSRMDWQR